MGGTPGAVLTHSLSLTDRFDVLGPTDPIVAEAGDDIILPCYLKPNISAENMTVDWRNLHFIDDLVYRYQNGKMIVEEDQIPSYRGRTSLFKEELRRGNTSLKLTRVQGSDHGAYECFIESNGWYDDAKIQVFVKAVGSRPVVSIEGHRDGGMGLLCESEGWHPEPELVWLDSKGVSLSDGRPETQRELNGFYTVKQQVIVQETDTNRFTCRVLQRWINVKVETEVHVPSELFDYTTPWRWSFIVSCCIGVFTVIMLLLAVYCIHKKKGVILGTIKQQREHLREENDDLKTYVFEPMRRHAVDVTLDPDTANPWLNLSDDGKQVYHTNIKQDLPDNPERFNQYFSVLGKEGFSSGRFYYEVQVEEKTRWILGVARESVNRKVMITPSLDDGYWTVWLWYGEYQVLTGPPVNLPLREKPQKVGVFVDYEEGQVSFFNVEARCLIYSFTGFTFTEKLYPYFNPCRNDGGKNSAPLVICPVNITD
ncbi:hypothetical protein UPYG_G00132500 [Umbra pygmaea]|uniref:Butyrophilin subfamily 1 member A1-like n=1 Tax=Umbra pygmaea TaxID=75934 RepID=A0ABD0XBX7_UMBPY